MSSRARRAAARADRARTRRRAAGAARAAQLQADTAAYLAAAQSAVCGSAARRLPTFARQLEALLADLAMERTRFEVRFADAARRGVAWTADGHRPRRVLRVAESRRGSAAARAHRVRRRAVAHHARHQDADGDLAARLSAGDGERAAGAGAPGLIFDEVDAGIGGRVADVVGRKLRALGSAFQVLCITHLPQIAAYADTHFQIEKRVERGRTSTTVERLDEDGAGRRTGADAWRGGDHRAAFGPRPARCLRSGSDRRRRKAKRSQKAKAKARKRKVDVARKYLIETFGCQMNVHDSERMAGLLEQAGFEATDDAATPTSSSSTRAASASAPRRSSTRGSASCASWRRSTATTRSSPSPAASRSRKARRSSSARPASPTSSSARRPSAGCRCSSSRPRARDQRTHRRALDLNPYDDVTFPLGVTRRSDPVKAYVTIIEGCNEFCSFCVVPVHARARAHAAQGRHPGRGARSGGQRTPGSPAARADREPLRGARRSGVRLHGPARGGARGARHRADPVREPAPAPRHAAVPRRDGAAAEGVPPPAPAGAVGLHAGARGHAPPLHAGELPGPGRRHSRARCRTSRFRPI